MSDLIKRIDQALIARPTTWTDDALLRDCRAEIERLSKPYVPMTASEIDSLWDENAIVCVARIETAVIARYNEQRGVK